MIANTVLVSNNSKDRLSGGKMKKTFAVALIIVISLTVIGCNSPSAVKTGFLSDYSRLSTASGGNTSYLNKQALRQYSSFIIDPVQTHLHTNSTAIQLKQKGELSQQNLRDLQNYMHHATVEAVEKAGYKIAYHAEPGVARIRIAITDVYKTNLVVSALPTARIITAAGTGGAAMEAEIVDSRTGAQLGAIVQAQTGSRIPLTGMSDWGGAEHAMEQWAKRLTRTLQQARQ